MKQNTHYRENNESPNQNSNSGTSLERLRQENINTLQTIHPQGGVNLQQNIQTCDSIPKQQKIKDYLELIQTDPLKNDFFDNSPSSGPHIETMLQNPSERHLKEAKILITKKQRRIKDYEKRSNNIFHGKNSADLMKVISTYYKKTLFNLSPHPSQNLVNQINNKGNKNFIFTQKELGININNINKIVDMGMSTFLYFDFFEEVIEKQKTERKKEIIKAAKHNLDKAKQNPKFFTQSFIQKLENINTNLNDPTKNNNIPIELILNFETNILLEQKKERLKLEQKVANQWKQHARLLGPKNIIKWEKEWLNKASIDQVNRFFHSSNTSSQRTQFNKMIQRRENYEKEFLKQLNQYPASNKSEYKAGFYASFDEIDTTLTQEKKQISYVFDYLKEKMTSVKESQKTAHNLIVQKQEFLNAEELSQLKNISQLTRSEQEELVQEIQKSSEKREHYINKYLRREKTFETEIEKYKDGISRLSKEEILKPMLDIYTEMKQDPFSKNLSYIRHCEEIQNEYETKEESNDSQIDFAKLFEEDDTIAALVLALKYSEQNEEDRSHENSSETPLPETNLQDNPQSQETFQETDDTDHNAEIGALKVETDLINNSDYIQNTIQDNKNIQEQFHEYEESQKEDILSNNESISDQVEDTNKNVVIRLSEFRSPTQVLTDNTKKKVVAAAKVNKTIYAESENKKTLSKDQKKQGLKKVIISRLSKFFGKREASKTTLEQQEVWDTLIKSRTISKNESYDSAKSKTIQDAGKLNKKKAS